MGPAWRQTPAALTLRRISRVLTLLGLLLTRSSSASPLGFTASASLLWMGTSDGRRTRWVDCVWGMDTAGAVLSGRAPCSFRPGRSGPGLPGLLHCLLLRGRVCDPALPGLSSAQGHDLHPPARSPRGLGTHRAHGCSEGLDFGPADPGGHRRRSRVPQLEGRSPSSPGWGSLHF